MLIIDKNNVLLHSYYNIVNMKKFFAFLLLLLGIFFTVNAQERTDSMHVAHYDIHLNITDFEDHVIVGHTNLTVVSKVDGLDYVNLDLKHLTVDSLYVDGVRFFSFTHEGELLSIQLQNVLNQNDSIDVSVFYRGVPARDSYFGGFYFSGEFCYNIGVAFRDLPHNFGRVWYPCMDFFPDRSTYQFHIETEVGKMAICGGYLVDSIATDSNTVIWNWNLDQPVPTYLTSVAVGPYMHYADTVQGQERVIPIDIYTAANYFDRIPATFSHLKDVVRIYEYRFGPYPWNRIGYVGVDFNAGAMEHVTNIAYPNFAISGNSTYESLYIHEFSHMWFGDLVTCNRAEEMWINEGFARYNEAVADELLYPSDNPETDGYRANIRALHRDVLRTAHIDDNGYWALDSMLQAVTYGTTTYDKGGLVVHTLRKYMGDSVFFAALREMFNTYAYQNISTEQLFDFLELSSGIPLHDFRDGWVSQPGFLHFSIDSVRPTGQGSEYRFFVRQRLSHARHFANSNKIDITFFSSEREQFTLENFAFDGEFGEGTVVLPFQPLFAIVDLNEKMGDAIIDYDYTLTGTGVKNASLANVKLAVNGITDTTFFRVEDNYVSADSLRIENENITAVSGSHYWRVALAPEGAVTGGIRFTYRANSVTDMDYDLLHGHNQNEVVLLYRRDPSEDWHIISSTQTGTIASGTLATEVVAAGEYAIGLGNRAAGLDQPLSPKCGIRIYPNPTEGKLKIENLDNVFGTGAFHCRITDIQGRKVMDKTLKNNQSTQILDISGLTSGSYLVSIVRGKTLVFTGKVVKR